MEKRYHLTGMFLVLLAASLNGLLPLMITSVYTSGGHPTNIMFYKGVLLAPAALIICLATRQPLKITLKENLSCLLLATLQTGTSLLLFSSYNYLATGTATTLHFFYPVAVLLITTVSFREKSSGGEILGVLLCVIGVCVLSYSPDGSIHLFGVLIALLSAVCYAGYLVTLGKSSASKLRPMVMTFYIFLYNAMISLIVSLFAGTMKSGLTMHGWLVMVACAFASGVVTVALQKGIKRIGEKISSVFCVAEPLVSVIVGIMFMNEQFSIKTVLGTLLVISAAVIVSLTKKEQA